MKNGGYFQHNGCPLGYSYTSNTKSPTFTFYHRIIGSVEMNTLFSLLGKALTPLIFTITLIFTTSLSAKDSGTEPLVVGINPYYKPLAYLDDGKITGIDPAAAEAVGELLGRKIQFKSMDFAELIPALQQGEIDVIMSGLSITDERKNQVDFTSPYLEIGQMAIIRLSDAGRLSYPAALQQPDKKIGVEPGTTGETYAINSLNNATVKRYDTPEQAFAALRKGDIDYYIHDAPTSWKLAQSREYNDMMSLYRPLTKEQLAWAVKKGNSSLLAQLNQALETLVDRGTMNLIQNHWIPVKVEVK